MTNQTKPYQWQAHHMLPGEAFYTQDEDGETVFSSQEDFDILLQAPYDIDHGHNMIMLPTVGWAVPVHALLQHPNNHNGYTKDVLKELKRIASQIDTLRGEVEDHKDIVANVFEALKMAEDTLWKELLSESRKAVQSAAEGKLYAGSWCRWQTQGGRIYDTWPSLW
ncbi:MAG: AHH domain-containing protein [Luteolibacter sp.]